jgi:hypothetical protein
MVGRNASSPYLLTCVSQCEPSAQQPTGRRQGVMVSWLRVTLKAQVHELAANGHDNAVLDSPSVQVIWEDVVAVPVPS